MDQTNCFALIAHLNTPLIVADNTWLTLDSILSAALTAEKGSYSPDDIPLRCIDGLFLGSAAFLIEPRVSMSPFLAALNPHYGDYDQDPRNKVLRVGGSDKPDLDMRRSYDVRRVVWFGVGDAEACRRLIGGLPGIGKKAAHGFGEIERVEAVALTADRSLVLPDGSPARPIPTSFWTTMAEQHVGLLPAADLPQDMTGFKPDYWLPSNRALCVVPQHRSLSSVQLQRIESGVAVQAPSMMTDIVREDRSAIEFFADHLGYKLVEAEGVPGNETNIADSCMACGSRDHLSRAGSGYTTLCQTCFTFGGTYRSIKRPGRMGAGWLGLVTPQFSKLVTSVEYPVGKVPFATVEDLEIKTGKEALSLFLRDTLLAPPDPPYLLFSSGNSSVKVMRDLAVTWSNRRIHISGNDHVILDGMMLKRNLLAWRDTGVRASVLSKAMQLRDAARYAYQSQQKDHANEQLEQLLRKHDFRSLLQSLPPTHSPDWIYLLRLMNLEEKMRQNKRGMSA